MTSLFFQHDFSASSDSKIIALRKEMGWEGYGLYWTLLEMLASDSNHRLPTDYNALGWELRADAEKIKRVICDFGLFTLSENGGSFYSDRLSKQLNDLDELRVRRSEAGKIGNEKRWKKNKIEIDSSQCDKKSSQCDKKSSQCDGFAIKNHRIKKEIKKEINTHDADAVINTSREKNSSTATASATTAGVDSSLDSWKYDTSNGYSEEFLQTLDMIASKFNVCDARMFAPQLDLLLRAIHRPGFTDGIQTVRDALNRLDTAKAITSGKVKLTIPKFLRHDIFGKLISGDYDEIYPDRNKPKQRCPDAGVSFENWKY